MPSAPSSRIFPGGSLLLILLLAAQAAGGLSEAERRGKRVYMEGTGRGTISAVLLGPGVKSPGIAFPCVNCHLPGGSGQLEGGVQSADITWFTLTKEFSGKRPSGRAHPPYDDESLVAAITSGLDPAGNELDPAHPRYEMGREDLRDLLAYLKVMDREPVPGIADNEVRVGILLPTRGPLAGAGAEVRALLSGHFAEVNARGGIYHRSLSLVPLPFDPAEDGAALAEARKAVREEEVFCFLANVGLSPEDEATRYLERTKVPVLVPLLTAPESGYAAGRYAFHVFASIRDQARVMTDFAASRLGTGKGRVAILYAEDPSGRGGAEGVREQAAKHGLEVGPEIPFAPGSFSAAETVRRLRSEEVGAVLYFGGPREALAFAEEAERLSWRPLFMAPAPMAGSALQGAPAGFLPGVFLAYPFLPPDPASPRVAEFFSLGEKYGVGKEHRLFQILAYSGAILLEEGLKRTGKGVTREKFVDTIGNVWKLETGVAPPLTYTPNRRAGATGAAIVGVDPESRRPVPAAPWREPM